MVMVNECELKRLHKAYYSTSGPMFSPCMLDSSNGDGRGVVPETTDRPYVFVVVG